MIGSTHFLKLVRAPIAGQKACPFSSHWNALRSQKKVQAWTQSQQPYRSFWVSPILKISREEEELRAKIRQELQQIVPSVVAKEKPKDPYFMRHALIEQYIADIEEQTVRDIRVRNKEDEKAVAEHKVILEKWKEDNPDRVAMLQAIHKKKMAELDEEKDPFFVTRASLLKKVPAMTEELTAAHQKDIDKVLDEIVELGTGKKPVRDPKDKPEYMYQLPEELRTVPNRYELELASVMQQEVIREGQENSKPKLDENGEEIPPEIPKAKPVEKKEDKVENPEARVDESKLYAQFEPLMPAEDLPPNAPLTQNVEFNMKAMSRSNIRPTHKLIIKHLQDNIFESMKNDVGGIRPRSEMEDKLEEMLKYSKTGSGRYGATMLVCLALIFGSAILCFGSWVSLPTKLFGWVSERDEEDREFEPPSGTWIHSILPHNRPHVDFLIPNVQRKPRTLVLDPQIFCKIVYNQTMGIRVVMRPGWDYFLQMVSPHYEIVLFTDGQWGAFDNLYGRIDPDRKYINYRIYSEGTYTLNGRSLKTDVPQNFRGLNRPTERMIILEPDPMNCDLFPRNSLNIPPWDGKDDRVMMDLAELLQDAAYSGNCEAFVCALKDLPFESTNTKWMYDLSPAIVNRTQNTNELIKTKNRQVLRGVDFPYPPGYDEMSDLPPGYTGQEQPVEKII
ncbi:mitochondrial matrix protein import-related protein [Planoprotostelium fungivorum]|uniref:Mitochondrial matrix protein import-related protein n=1 Tax=Planoprotostelium fungivorum TaxID=1890364 RepID=A0A2P6NV06_9EUKA|nr:mitochondrial matrix protein import-related protein [Planoprotostelium fungivorum]